MLASNKVVQFQGISLSKASSQARDSDSAGTLRFAVQRPFFGRLGTSEIDC